MFALAVGTLTNASTAEMFGATAAYVFILIKTSRSVERSANLDRFAAVLVVFIATGLPA